MTRHNAQELEKTFIGAASLRISRKERGNEDYAKDNGYWDGGLCDWGGEHNLKEDCQTIARSLGKLDELKQAEEELKKCTSKEEFEATKSRLIRQCEELQTELKLKTSNASSMFGVCIIWSYFPEFIESKLKTLQNEVSRFKSQINSQQYKYYQELKSLKLEQKQIEQRMKENKRKASDPKISPEEKATLLQSIEDDGELLKENLKKQKAIPATNLKFDPDKYVSDLIEAMKEAIKKGGKGGGSGGGSGKNKPDPTDSDNSDSDDDIPEPTKPSKPPNQTPKDNQNKNQQQLIIFGGITILVIFYLYSQKEKTESNEYYDY